MKIRNYVLVISLASVQGTALGKGVPTSTFQELRRKCAELPENLPHLPIKLVVRCQSVTTLWKAAPSSAAGRQLLHGKTDTVGTIVMYPDGLPVTLSVDEPTVVDACRAEEWTRRSEIVDIETSCSDLAGDTFGSPGSIADFCGTALEQRFTEDPSLVGVEAPTGRVSDRCAR